MTPDVFAIGLVSTTVLWLGRIVLRKELFDHAERIESRDRRKIDRLVSRIADLEAEREELYAENAARGRQIQALTAGGPYRAGGDR